MSSTQNSGLGHGTVGAPQGHMEEQIYPTKAAENEASSTQLHYVPSPKHMPGYGWGSANPIKTNEEGQHLLDTGYHHGKQVYNTTVDGKIVKFQPDGTSGNGFHAYEVTSPPDIPPVVLKQMLLDGKITKSDYNRILKGKKK